MILDSYHLPVQTHHINFRLTLSNFFGEREEIQSKLHSIVPALLSLQLEGEETLKYRCICRLPF